MSHWAQGQHVVLIGMNGSGKTGVERKLLEYRQHVVFLRTKPDDFLWTGWKTIKDAGKIDPNKYGKWILDPTYELQVPNFLDAFNMAWEQGGWTVCIDEFYHFVKTLKMDFHTIKLLTQGRSKHISVVGGIQRPSWVPRFVLSEPTHVFAFRMGDKRDLDAIADAIDERVAAKVKNLPRYSFVYFNKLTEELQVGDSSTLSAIFPTNPKFRGKDTGGVGGEWV